MQHDSKLEIGQRIRALRIAAGFSREYVAQMTGSCEKTVNNTEKGVCYPSMESLLKLIELYKVTSDYILNGGNVDPNLDKKLGNLLKRKKGLTIYLDHITPERVQNMNLEDKHVLKKLMEKSSKGNPIKPQELDFYEKNALFRLVNYLMEE